MKKEKKKSVKIKADKKEVAGNIEKIDSEKSAISWQAPEFESHPKDVSWYWLSLITTIIILALAVWQKNFLFALFIVIAWLVIIYLSRRSPTVWQFRIDEKGIEISLPKSREARKFYPYEEINGFDIKSGSDKYKELILKLKTKLSPYLKINIHSADEEKIKNFLLKFLLKEEYHVSLADSVSKLIGF
jgi:hypothetical protein